MAAVWRTMTRIRRTIDRKRWQLLLLLPLVPAAAFAAYIGGGVGEDDLSRGRQLYADNCASCHGADLEGQSDWKRRLSTGRMPAPPHDASGHTWHHPDRVLFDITKLGPAAIIGGGYESDMPGFADSLTDAEIRVVLDYIKSTWPERERQFQVERTRADQEARR
ncbi:MAG: c-type cytochrome [Paracoccaceae bacterium]